MRIGWIAGAVVVALAGGCDGGASGSGPSCVLEDVLARSAAGTAPMDCGHLAVDATVAAQQAAHDCALAAAAAQRAFVVTWDGLPTDSRIAFAYQGLGAGGTWTLTSYRYDSDPSGGNQVGPVTNSQPCATLADLGDCGAQRPSTLCLVCGTPGPGTQCK